MGLASYQWLMIRLLPILFSLVAPLLFAGQEPTVTWPEMPVHGLAAGMETPGGRVVLIDEGDTKSSPDYNASRDTIAPFLQSRGHEVIDAIIVSHPHGDHYGGAEWLIQNMEVKAFIDHNYEGRGQTLSSTRLRGLAVQRGGEHRVVHSGDRLSLDDALTLDVLSPPKDFLDAASDPAKVSDHGLLNSNSVVLRVQHGDNVFIFPGDSYGGTFEKHVKTLPPGQLKATVLTANHHGFNPGIDFPTMVMPKFVVASCVADYPANANTPYPRSPGDNAIKVYGALGADGFVTAFNGNVTAVSDGRTVRMSKGHERATP